MARVTEPYDIGGAHARRVGLSLGGAGWPEDDRAVDQVLNMADAALYAAKRAARAASSFIVSPCWDERLYSPPLVTLRKDGFCRKKGAAPG